eukprot:m.143583 g.143583  ORF g.143583 m.143583 type:complete len:735 (+) comp16020_c2_seq3:172-2376(+)
MDVLRASIERSLGMSEPDQKSAELFAEERETLLRRVSDAVKAVQRAYMGSTAIATDQDSQVTCLCAQLEAVLCHGLKSARKRGVEISYWPFVRSFLLQADVKEITLLSNITTDSGRGRAWLRSTLNDQTLKTYIQQFSQKQDQAKLYYDDFAFVLDEEKMSMLAMLLQGLEMHFMLEMDTKAIDSPRMTPSAVTTRSLSSSAEEPTFQSSDTVTVGDTIVLKTKKKQKKKKKSKKKDEEAEINPVADDEQEPANANDEETFYDDEPSSSVPPPDFSALSVEEIIRQTTAGVRLSEEEQQQADIHGTKPETTPVEPHGSSEVSVSSTQPFEGNTIDQPSQSQDMQVSEPVQRSESSNTRELELQAELDKMREMVVTIMRAKEEIEEERITLQTQVAERDAKLVAAERVHAEAIAAYESKADEYVRSLNAANKEKTLLKEKLKALAQENHELRQQLIEAATGEEEDGVVDEEDAVDEAEDGQADLNMSRKSDLQPDVEDLGGYESVEQMVSMHEKKVLQLTQMHSELLELNEHLQQQVREREIQIVQLGGELPASSLNNIRRIPATASPSRPMKSKRVLSPQEKEYLRVPSGIGIQVPGSDVQIHLWIPSAQIRGHGSDAYYVYQICVQVRDEKWNVFRRYTHFYDLNRQVQHIFPDADLKLPQKKSLSRKGPKFIEQRRLELEQYMRHVVSLCVTQTRSPLLKDPCKRSLCEALPFLKERMGRRTSSRQNSYSGL